MFRGVNALNGRDTISTKIVKVRFAKGQKVSMPSTGGTPFLPAHQQHNRRKILGVNALNGRDTISTEEIDFERFIYKCVNALNGRDTISTGDTHSTVVRICSVSMPSTGGTPFLLLNKEAS